MSGMIEEEWDFLNGIVCSSAIATARGFKGFATHDDIQQELWLWVLASKHKIARWRVDMNDEDFEKMLRRVFRDVGTKYCREQKAEALGYKLGDEFYYTTGMLKEILPSVFDRDAWINPPPVKGEGAQNSSRRSRTLDEGFNWVATLADVARAVDTLPERDQNLLRLVFSDAGARKDLAQSESVTVRAIDHRVDRALRHLLDALGGPKWLSEGEDRRPGGYGRKAISNAHARAITDSDYDPEGRLSDGDF